MHDELCRRMMLGELGKDFDWVGGPEVGISNVTIGLESFAYQHNFAWDFQAATRWAKMVRQYVDPVALDDTLDRIEKYMGKKRGVAALRLTPPMGFHDDPDEHNVEDGEHLATNMVKERVIGKRMSRRWGSCMLSLTYRNVPRPTVTLNSRTSYFGMLAMMDVTVANVFARMCGERTGYDVGEMQFVWQLNLAQWHGFRSLAWAFCDEDARATLDAYVDRRDDITKQAGLWRTVTGYRRIVRLDREGVLYGDEKFASALRMRKRYHAELKGSKYAKRFAGGSLHPDWGKPFTPLPDLWSDDLTFSPIGR